LRCRTLLGLGPASAGEAISVESGVLSKVTAALDRLSRIVQMLNYSLILLMFAALSGAYSGVSKANMMKAELQAGCPSTCFVYDDGVQGIVGMLLAQDPQRTAIAVAGGVRIIETSKLWKIRPFVRGAERGAKRRG